MAMNTLETVNIHSPNTSGLSKACTEMNIICERVSNPVVNGVYFRNNENISVVELCAKYIKPVPHPRIKKRANRDLCRTSVDQPSSPNNSKNRHSHSLSSPYYRRSLRSDVAEPSPLDVLPFVRRMRRPLHSVFGKDEPKDNEKAKCLKLDPASVNFNEKTIWNDYTVTAVNGPETTHNKDLTVDQKLVTENGPSMDKLEVCSVKDVEKHPTISNFSENVSCDDIMKTNIEDENKDFNSSLTCATRSSLIDSSPDISPLPLQDLSSHQVCSTSLISAQSNKSSKMLDGFDQNETNFVDERNSQEHSKVEASIDNIINVEMPTCKEAELLLEVTEKQSARDHLVELTSESVASGMTSNLLNNSGTFKFSEQPSKEFSTRETPISVSSYHVGMCKLMEVRAYTCKVIKPSNVVTITQFGEVTFEIGIAEICPVEVDFCSIVAADKHEVSVEPMLESWNSDIAEQEMDHMKNIKINSTMETELSLQPTNASIATAQVLREETTEVEKEAMIVQEAGEEALEQVANDSPSINIAYREASLEMSGANQDEVELGDGTNHKKMIPEVCACDTTTGSLEDDVSGNKLLNFQEPSMKESIDANAPLNSINKGKHKKRVVSKFGRRQWGKELTKIRMKLLEHKKLKRNAGLALARQTRQKRLEARKALNNLNKHRMESKLSLNNHIKKLSSHCTPRKADLTEMATIFSEDTHNSTSALENDPVTIVNLATQCDIASKPFSLMKMDKSNIVENTNNSSNIQLEQIEIVEDEDDNEVDEDPWPFATSPFPANSSCSQKSTASPPPSVKSLLSPVSLPAEDTDEPSKMRVGATEKSSQLLTKNNSSIEEYRQILSQIDKENFLDCNPAAAVTENQNNPSLLSPSSPFLNSKNDTAKIKVPSMAHDCSVTFSRGLETPNSPDRSKGEHLQQAKMHSRSAEFERTNSLADSMWKDMFNSDVMPLDFDEDTPTQRLPGSQKLSAVFQTKLALERCDKEALSPGYVNTPCGDSFPEMKTNRLERVTASTLKLCTCKIGSSPVSQPRKKSLSPDFYCQAVETLGSKISNCVARTSDKLERRRAASRLPLMVLCKQHWKKLSHHGCCPVCGLFCTSGTFIDCTSGKGHLHHSACQVKGNDDIYLCPHCGEKSSQVTVHLFNKATTDTQRSSKAIRVQGNEGIARMCIRLVSRPPTSSGETSSNAGYDNKLFEVSKSTLLDGAAKTKLISIMSGLEHLLPAMNEKLESTRIPTVTVYDLSSYIIKNDLSQLALGICEMLNKSKSHRLLTLNKELSEQDGKTLLHIAVQSNSLATVHCLVIAGVEVNTADAKGVSPLMLAAKMNQLDIVKYLIGAGALVEWRDIDGMTSLHCAAVAGNKAICDYMLKEAHANIDCADEGGWTPLIWAIDNGHTQVVKLLLNCQAALHKRDSEGNTCIHWGAYSGNTDIIRLLIKRGADIEAINELGDRPLHIAVKQARTDAVILLLSHGADTTVINNLHQTPAECCHGACSENMKSFLAVNNVLRSCRLGNVVTRASRLLHQDIAKGKERVPIPVTNDLDDTNYPTDFIYITDSVCTSPVPINNLINSLARCNCVGDCTKASCSCARSSISCWYESSGILSSEFNFSNPPQLFECNRACGCWTTCSNRVVQQGITSQLELFKTRHRGWGVKARHEIAKGTFVCEYVGELITDSEADERADDSYLFDLDSKDGDTYCIDAKHYGNISRFINHRCEPNLTPVNVFIDHQDVRFPRICFFANTDIDPGTELGFDYGEKFWLVKYKHFLCDCGCKTCKYSEETIADTLFVCQSSDRIQATNLGSPV